MRRNRKWGILVGVLLVAFIGLGWFIVSLTGEHPDYVRAAKELPTAKARAEANFGPLTWEEYRKAHGITTKSDLAEWRRIESTIPTIVDDYFDVLNAPTPTEVEVLTHERAWFLSLDDEIEGLGFQHEMFPGGDDWNVEAYGRLKALTKACHVGLVGAADTGDAALVLEIGRAMNKVNAVVNQEPSILGLLVFRAQRAIAEAAIMRAACRNRDNDAVMDALRQIAREQPQVPTPREFIGGNVRQDAIYRKQMAACPLGELDALLDTWTFDFEPQDTGIVSWIRDKWSTVTGKEPKHLRRVGPNTKAALEARSFEVMTRFEGALSLALKGDFSAYRSLEKSLATVKTRREPSYEFALAMTSTLVTKSYLNGLFVERATLASIEMLRRFPELSSVPESLPSDLSFSDPFGGKPVLYMRTDQGFVLYPRGMDLDDDKFVPFSPDLLSREGRFVKGAEGHEWGFVVSYVPKPN